MLFDETGGWQGVVAYLLTLPAQEVDRMAAAIPGVRPAWQVAQQWGEGPSSAAWLDIAGAEARFNIDGTVSVTRQTVKEYFGGGGAGRGAGGGGYYTGGTGASGQAVGYRTGDLSDVPTFTDPATGKQMWNYAGRWWTVPPDRSGRARFPSDDPERKYSRIPPGFDWNKYYGGEGPQLYDYEREGIPEIGQYGPQPPRRRRGVIGAGAPAGDGSGEGGTGTGTRGDGDGRPSAVWRELTAQIDPRLLQAITAYFSAAPEELPGLYQQFPNLAAWLAAQDPQSLVDLEAAWRAMIAEPEMGQGYNGNGRGGPLILRNYPRRSGRSGLE